MSTDVKSWTSDQETYIAWLALPRAQRKPKTQRELAKQLDVAEETLSRWKHEAGFMDDVNTLARDLVKHDIAEILGVIRSRAKKGELAYVNMALAMAGMATDVEAAGRGPSEIKAYVGISPDDWHGSESKTSD
jgi:ribosomal protein L29